jgi:hypothetical protein
MNLLLLSYILVPIAFFVMLVNYRTTNWLWLGFLVLSTLIGVAPYMALAYLVSVFVLDKSKKPTTKTTTYHPDGSYTVYKSEDTKSAPSPGKIAFRIIGGLIAGAAVCFGIYLIGIMLLVSVSCAGSSKCM